MESRPRVLDASAVLAWIFEEPGSTYVGRNLEGRCLMSTVNLAEVTSKLSDLQLGDPEQIAAMLRMTGMEVQHFDEQQAIASSLLRHKTRHKGLSLGDRACLALGQAQNATVLTCDQAWLALDLGIDIIDVRSA